MSFQYLRPIGRAKAPTQFGTLLAKLQMLVVLLSQVSRWLKILLA